MKLFVPIFLIFGLLAIGCKSDGSGSAVSSISGKKTKKVVSVDNSKITFKDGSTKDLPTNKSVIFLVPCAEHYKNEENKPIETVDLLPEGKQRAANLAKILDGVDLGAVMSSSQVRTALTVQPTGTAKKLGTFNYNSNTRHRIFEFIFDYNPGKKFLIGGENYSIPLIIADLTGFDIKENLPEDAHDVFYVLTGGAAGSCNVEEYSY